MLDYLFDADYNIKEVFFLKPKRKTSRHKIKIEDLQAIDDSIAFDGILRGECL